MTVTTTSRWLEVRAQRSSHRFKALAALHEAGVPTFAFVGPLLPHFAERPDLPEQLFRQLVDAGVREVYMEHTGQDAQHEARLLGAVLIDEPSDGGGCPRLPG
jgi:DNA repair photolyase